MRGTLTRVAAVAAGAALFATVGLPSGVASAEDSGDCVKERSVRLYTQGPNDEDRLWVDQQSLTRVVVCLRLDSAFFGGIAIVFDATNIVTLPSVRTGTNPAACPQVVRDIADPVSLRLAVALATNTVCLTLDGKTTTVQFDDGDLTPAMPLEIWRDGGENWGLIDIASCPVEYAVLITITGPTGCLEHNERIFP